jgi:tetratricopeptide (TPR) repeat protein
LAGAGLWFYVLGPQPPEIAAPVDPGAAQDIAEARAAVKGWPFRASKWGRLGIVLGEYGFDREAIVCFQQAGRLDPWNPRWPYLRGIFEAKSDADAGLPHLQRSVQMGGTAVVPRLALGEALLRLGQADEAEDNFRAVLQAEPENARALLGMGRVAHDKGDLQPSRDYLKRSAAAAWRVKATHALLADVYQRLGDANQADLERSLADSLPQNVHWPDPYYALSGPALRGRSVILRRAATHLAENRPEEALPLLKGLPPTGAPSYGELLLLGRVHARLGDVGDAVKAFESAIAAQPDAVEARYELGNLLEKDGKFADAAEQFRKVIQLKPETVASRGHLAQCLKGLGRTDEAVTIYQELVRLRPDLAAAHKGLGVLLQEVGRDEEALAALGEACKLAPDDADARRRLEGVRARLGSPKGPADSTPPGGNPMRNP